MLRFGTDGIRGNAEADLETELVISVGRAIARVLQPPLVLIGRDTRESGTRIESELMQGIISEPCNAVSLGVTTTPAIAFVAAASRWPALVVSASHNPWSDNGVKVIGPDGRKLPDDLERAIEREIAALHGAPTSAEGSRSVQDPTFDYEQHLLRAIEGRTLDGLRVVLDCANGAGYEIGPRVLRDAGADVVVMHAKPNGRNINDDCGSTHPESLQRAVREHDAALGLALDGDGDRVLAVDETGALVDGDQIMVMTALDLHARGHLRNDAIAVTVMSNLGLRRALRASGIELVETPVGDRHVVSAMQAHDLALGGEQSGHIIYAEHATTGDGLLTGLLLCDLVRRSGRKLSDLGAQMQRVPQLLVNVRVARGADLDAAPAVGRAVAAAAERLGDTGRVLVRASGTEPLVRIMVEADEQAMAEATAEELRAVVEAEFGGAANP